MGKKEARLKEILVDNSIIDLTNRENPINQDIIYSEIQDQIFKVYKNLGGIEQEYSYRGRCDIVSNEYIIELDEERHFNEYRLTTLKSPLYNELKKFPIKEYMNYCNDYKDRCLNAGAHGGYWSNNRCEAMFGIAQTEGDLSGNGSPRWKQRAFYDFVKDVSYLVTNIHVVRLSIYDIVDYQTCKFKLGDLLENDNTISEYAAQGIKKLIDKQIVKKKS